MCTTCQFPTRRLWTFQHHPEFASEHRDGWARLDLCPHCGQLWCRVGYEPYASFTFWAAWPSTKKAWIKILNRDHGLPYYEWHEAVVIEDHAKLPKAESDAVAAWRSRARGRTPIDERRPRYCPRSSDIQRFIDVSQSAEPAAGGNAE